MDEGLYDLLRLFWRCKIGVEERFTYMFHLMTVSDPGRESAELYLQAFVPSLSRKSAFELEQDTTIGYITITIWL